jgi:hypothetical protein
LFELPERGRLRLHDIGYSLILPTA